MIIGPIAHFSFIMKTANKLFYARTFDNDIFQEYLDCTTKKFFNSALLTHTELTEIKTHKKILIDKNKLYKLYCTQ